MEKATQELCLYWSIQSVYAEPLVCQGFEVSQSIRLLWRSFLSRPNICRFINLNNNLFLNVNNCFIYLTLQVGFKALSIIYLPQSVFNVGGLSKSGERLCRVQILA